MDAKLHRVSVKSRPLGKLLEDKENCANICTRQTTKTLVEW